MQTMLVDTLVLGGGGVKSMAYLGAMEEMVARGRDWDSFCEQLTTVAGASAGAFSAACVATGLPLKELERILLDFDSSKLFAPSLTDSLLRNFDCVFKFPVYGLVEFDKLQSLYEDLAEQMGLCRKITLLEFYEATGKTLDVYVSNLSLKRVECWSWRNHPSMPLAFALAVSSALPLIVSAPVIGGVMYGDGGIMGNVPVSSQYDVTKTLVMMIDIEPHGEKQETAPRWFGHYLSRIFDAVYEGHRHGWHDMDAMWQLQTVRLHCESVTLMDTFKHGKLPKHLIESGKQEGRYSYRLWLAERAILEGLIKVGLRQNAPTGKEVEAAKEKPDDGGRDELVTVAAPG